MEKINLEIPTLTKIQKEGGKKPTTIKKYPYINEEGEIIYEVHRMKNAEEPYYVMRPLENGEYKVGLGKVKSIPYNLPDVIEAKKDGKVIIITEGESKVDIFKELGYVATTAPFSNTNKWLSRYNKYIKYTSILIIADNDDKGREFAETTFDTASDVTKNIGILELSSIYPQLKEGGDIEDLRQIVGNDEQLKEALNHVIKSLIEDENE